MHAFFLTTAFLAPLALAQIQGHCDPIVPSQPLPSAFALKYRNQPTTGTVNGTIAILPISLTAARKIIPSQYPILTAQYKAWLGDAIGDDQYPALLQMEQNHDIYKLGKQVGDSGDFQRASISFPFVDRLNDGYSSFLYNHAIILSSANTVAIKQFTSYGGVVAPGFTASCNPYEYDNATANIALPPKQRRIDQAAWGNANTDLSNPDIAYRLTPVTTSPINADYWYNVTNQPLFSDSTTGKCDSVVRVRNTKVSLAPYTPVALQGDVAILQAYYSPKAKTTWTGVYGYKVDQSYYEKPQQACANLKGVNVVSAPA